MIEKLKNLVVARYSIEELIEMRATARMIYEEYTSGQKLNAPDWLSNAVNELDREIADKVRDERLRRLSEVRARRAQLRTTEEKRSEADQEIADLENALGIKAAPAQN